MIRINTQKRVQYSHNQDDRVCLSTMVDSAGVLTMGKPEEVRMSGPVLKAAASLYSEAAAR
jgi:hypothetical protein